MKNFLRKLVVITMLLGAVELTTSEMMQSQAKVVQASRVKKHYNKRHKVRHHPNHSFRKGHRPWANVFIGIRKNSADYHAARDAIKAWNRTKVVKFKQVKSAKHAYIDMRRNNYGHTRWAGREQKRYSYRHHCYYYHIRLNDYFLRQVNFRTRVLVSEHELGHVLGLKHNYSQASIMNPSIDSRSGHGIHPIDIYLVKRIYDLR